MAFNEMTLQNEPSFRVLIRKIGSVITAPHPNGIEPGYEFEGYENSGSPTIGYPYYVGQAGRELRVSSVLRITNEQDAGLDPETDEVIPRSMVLHTERSIYKVIYLDEQRA
jgi:hypothetical protein